MTDAQLKNGLKRTRNFTGYFSLPAFRELCRSADTESLGLPDARTAYREACMKPNPKAAQHWSHPAVYHAGVATSWFNLHASPTDEIFPAFERYYSELCKRVVAGEDLEMPVTKALPEKVTVFLTPEQNQQRMSDLRGSLGI